MHYFKPQEDSLHSKLLVEIVYNEFEYIELVVGKPAVKNDAR